MINKAVFWRFFTIFVLLSASLSQPVFSEVSTGRLLSNKEVEIISSAECRWSDAENKPGDHETIVGYSVKGCKGAVVCTGTMQCEVHLDDFPSGPGGKTIPIDLEHVMCSSSITGFCPSAKECLMDGGMIKFMQTYGVRTNTEKIVPAGRKTHKSDSKQGESHEENH